MFTFEALNHAGKSQTISVKALDSGEAHEIIKAMGYVPTSLRKENSMPPVRLRDKPVRSKRAPLRRDKTKAVLLVSTLLIGVATAIFYFSDLSATETSVPQEKLQEQGQASPSIPLRSQLDGESQLNEANLQLKEIRRQIKEHLDPAIRSFENDQFGLKSSLASIGVRGSKDLKDKPKARVFAGELAEVVAYLELLRRKKQGYESAAFELEAVIRRYSRQQAALDAGLGDDELERFSYTLKQIDSRLNALEGEAVDIDPTMVDQVVDRALGNKDDGG